MNFSVLMSLYIKENPDYFRQSLDSVFNQTLRPDEVILVLDGPLTPELEEAVNEYSSKYPEIVVVPLVVNNGLGKALNEGLKHCTHDLVVRMDTDDVCFPNRFERQIKFMEANPDIDICGSWIEEFQGSIDNAVSIKKVPLTHEQIGKYLCYRNPLNHPTVVFRKTAVEETGGYKHFPLFEDYYLWARMYVAGAKFANIPEILLHFRISPLVYKRRGGWKYAMDSARFQWTLHKLGLTSTTTALKASIMRGIVYVMPNRVRAFVYSKFLRS